MFLTKNAGIVAVGTDGGNNAFVIIREKMSRGILHYPIYYKDENELSKVQERIEDIPTKAKYHMSNKFKKKLIKAYDNQLNTRKTPIEKIRVFNLKNHIIRFIASESIFETTIYNPYLVVTNGNFEIDRKNDIILLIDDNLVLCDYNLEKGFLRLTLGYGKNNTLIFKAPEGWNLCKLVGLK